MTTRRWFGFSSNLTQEGYQVILTRNITDEDVPGRYLDQWTKYFYMCMDWNLKRSTINGVIMIYDMAMANKNEILTQVTPIFLRKSLKCSVSSNLSFRLKYIDINHYNGYHFRRPNFILALKNNAYAKSNRLLTHKTFIKAIRMSYCKGRSYQRKSSRFGLEILRFSFACVGSTYVSQLRPKILSELSKEITAQTGLYGSKSHGEILTLRIHEISLLLSSYCASFAFFHASFQTIDCRQAANSRHNILDNVFSITNVRIRDYTSQINTKKLLEIKKCNKNK